MLILMMSEKTVGYGGQISHSANRSFHGRLQIQQHSSFDEYVFKVLTIIIYVLVWIS